MTDYLKKQLDSINDLEKELANLKTNNMKRKFLLQAHKSLLHLKRLIPYVIITGITTGCFSFVSIPFYRDNRHKDLWLKKEFDSNGNKVIEEQYEEYKEDSEVSFVSKWKEYDDEYYIRNITTYQIKALTNEELERLIMEKDPDLNKVLGNPIFTKTEKKNNLTEEELNEESFIRAIIYDKSEGAYKVVKESARDNDICTLLWLVAVFVSNGIYSISVFNMKSHDKLIENINDLVDKYPMLDEEELKRRLAIRKETYERLNR